MSLPRSDAAISVERTAEQIKKVDHVALAVESMADAATFFRDVLGGTFLCGGDNDTTGVRLVHLMLHGFKLELMQPLRDDSTLSEAMRRRGPGFHHMTFLVDDLPRTVTALHADGYTPVDTDTRLPAWSETFLSPRSTFGALLQFVTTNLTWDIPAQDYTLDDVLAGRIVWRDYIACIREPGESAGSPSVQRDEPA